MEPTTSVGDSIQQYKNVYTVKVCNINSVFVKLEDNKASSCLYRASMTIKTLYYPTEAQIYN